MVYQLDWVPLRHVKVWYFYPGVFNPCLSLYAIRRGNFPICPYLASSHISSFRIAMMQTLVPNLDELLEIYALAWDGSRSEKESGIWEPGKGGAATLPCSGKANIQKRKGLGILRPWTAGAGFLIYLELPAVFGEYPLAQGFWAFKCCISLLEH